MKSIRIASLPIFALIIFGSSFAQTQNKAAFSRLLEAVNSGAEQYDHIATIGELNYYVYIDRSTLPATVLIKETQESLDSLFDVKNIDCPS